MSEVPPGYSVVQAKSPLLGVKNSRTRFGPFLNQEGGSAKIANRSALGLRAKTQDPRRTMTMEAPPSVDELKAEGNALYKQGQYLKAAASYSKAIKLDKENGVLYRCVR